MYRKAKRENNFEQEEPQREADQPETKTEPEAPVTVANGSVELSIKNSSGPPQGYGPTGTDYSLVYFGGVRNKAEAIRLVFTYYGIPYEDRFVTFEEWPKLKPETPMGALPVLYTKDGRSLCQSYTIARFIAREYGNLAGITNLDAAKVDMLTCGMYDLIVQFEHLILHGSDQAEGWSEFEREHLILFLERYNQMLEDNGGLWFVGESVTLADLAIAEYLSTFREYWSSDVLVKYPLLEKLIESVQNLPNIKEYIEQRGPSLMKI